MTPRAEDPPRRPSRRLWLGIAAGAVALAALAGVLALALSIFGPHAIRPGHDLWLFWVAAIPACFLLAFAAQAVLEESSAAHVLAVRSLPIVLLVLFFAAYFIFAA